MHDAGLAGDDVRALFSGDSGIFEKTADVANHLRIRQLGAPHLAHPAEHLLRGG